MYRYIVEKHCGPYVIFPNRSEQPLSSYKAFIVPMGSKVASTARRFQYEKALSLEENCVFFANRTWEKGVTVVDVDSLSLDEIYKYATGFVPANSGKAVEVVVVRS